MTNWVYNRLYVKNTGPEFNVLKEIFTSSECPFEKFHPMPIELASEMTDIDLLIMKSQEKRKHREYWNPKINKLIEKLNCLGLSLPLLRDVDYQDPVEILFKDKVKHRTSINQQVKIWLRHRREEINIKKYGAKDWSDWRCKNWGTQWDACDLEVVHSDDNEFCIEFQTAWMYPAGIYIKLGLDFPNSTLMTLAYSMDSDFIKCASHTPGKDWECEDLGSVFDTSYAFLSPWPSVNFIDFSKQFDTDIPEWFMETELEKIDRCKLN